MGKNQRHKKVLKSEKAKVKLKQSKTKFLPKGQNITNTTFKIKPIVLREQLRAKSSDDILSKRKLNIKDLLSRLKHYNENVKQTACNELSEIIREHPKDVVQQQFSDICLTISGLMQDREPRVRRAAMKVIDSILSNIPSEKLQPFLSFFATNLRCAMTNINIQIQEDSLLFLDCFIKVDCGFLSKSAEKLLPDFFTLISKFRNDSKLERTLTLNLGSKMTSVAWRIKVLSRLHAILKLLLSSSDYANKNQERKIKLFKSSQTSFLPIHKENYKDVLSNCNLDVFNDPKSTYSDKSAAVFNRHITTLVPLLYETWLEVIPESRIQRIVSDGTELNEESSALLACIMNTLYLLWQYIHQFGNRDINMETVFMNKEGVKFLKHLLANFPYYQPNNRPNQKLKNGALRILTHNNDPKCIYENLLVCFMYSVLFIDYNQKDVRKDLVSITDYITKIMLQKSYIGEDSTECIVQLLEECLCKNYKKWRQYNADLQSILESTVRFYQYSKIKVGTKSKIFNLLSSVIDNDYLNKSNIYQTWLQNLPHLLCEPEIDEETILSLLNLSKKNCKTFHDSVLEMLPSILGNLVNLKVNVKSKSLLMNDDLCKRNVAYIFYYIPLYSKDDLKIICDYLQENPESNMNGYIQDVFKLRSEFGKTGLALV